MARFQFKDLDVYREALVFFTEASAVAWRIPRHRAFVADQWLRAALSILLNLAEGASEYSGKDKARFFRIARRSAAESSALLDALHTMSVIDRATLDRKEARLGRIAAMLTRLAKQWESRSQNTRTRTRTRTRTNP